MEYKCIIKDCNRGEEFGYTGAIYTKLDGIYGYLCVDLMKVKFFWVNENSTVCCDDLSDRFKVTYIIE